MYVWLQAYVSNCNLSIPIYSALSKISLRGSGFCPSIFCRPIIFQFDSRQRSLNVVFYGSAVCTACVSRQSSFLWQMSVLNWRCPRKNKIKSWLQPANKLTCSNIITRNKAYRITSEHYGSKFKVNKRRKAGKLFTWERIKIQVPIIPQFEKWDQWPL